MSSRSSTSSFRRSLALGGLLLAAGFAAVDLRFAPVSFFGGAKLAAKYERLRALERSDDVRVLVLGPSFADMGFDAERFTERSGKLTYNMGIAGTDLAFQAQLLRDVLIPLVEPEIVLWCMREELRTRSHINHQYLNAPALRWAGGPGGFRVFELASHLPQFQKRRIQGWADELEAPDETIDAFGQSEPRELRRARPGDGAVELDEERAAQFGQRSEDSVTAEFARAVFADALRVARERGVKVYAFLTPYHEDLFIRQSFYTRAMLTGVYADYQRWLRETLEEHGVPLIDLHHCAPISGEESFFYDGRHLNRLGAAPATDVLADIVLGGTVPEPWRGYPARAELEAMLGTRPDDVPRLALGEWHALDAARLVRDGQGHAIGLYARFEVPRPGTYRLELSGADRAPDASYFVRAGGEHHLYWEPSPEASEADALALELPAGTIELELHRARNRSGLERERFALLPVAAASSLDRDAGD